MTGDSRAIEPFGFFSLESLRAGWYLAWRLVVFTLPFTVGPMVVAALVAAWGLWLAVPFITLVGLVLGVVAAVRITNHVANVWALGEYGRPLPKGVWWSVTWRVLLVSVPLSLLLTPFLLISQGPLLVGGVLDLVLPVIGLSLAGFFVVATVQSYGWAMSTAVADRLGVGGPLDELDASDETEPVRARALVPRRPAPSPTAARARRAVPPRRPEPARRPAPRPAAATLQAPAPAAVQCPKCGLRETERGSVIGWYCRICGWRERRA